MAHTWCGSSGFKHVQGASASLPKIEATPTPASTSKAKKLLQRLLLYIFIAVFAILNVVTGVF